MASWKCPEKWNIVFPFASGVMNIWREDNRIFVNEDARGSGSPKEIILSEAPQLTNELADRISRKFYTGLRGLNLLGWIVGGIWLVTVHL